MTQPKMPTKSSLKWGITREPIAKKKYIEAMQKSHRGFRVLDSGLLIHKQYGYIRGSPDGVVVCECPGCQSPRLLEIKAPYTCRFDTWDTIVQTEKLPYLQYTAEGIGLKNTCNFGYLDQVQGAMAVSGTKMCDVVIYTTKSLAILPFTFNEAYWSSCVLPPLKQLWVELVVPQLLTDQNVGMLDLTDLSDWEEDEEADADNDSTNIDLPQIQVIQMEVGKRKAKGSSKRL